MIYDLRLMIAGDDAFALESGAKATAVQTLRVVRGTSETREAFGLRRVHRRFGAGQAQGEKFQLESANDGNRKS